MKRLIVRWIVGRSESGDPVFRRQQINVSDDFSFENAQTVVRILDKYSQYTCGGAELQTTQSVGDVR